MPIPHKDEAKDIFLERCMGTDTMVNEYPDEKQRYAVCLTQWKEKEKKAISTDIEKRTFSFQMNIEKREDETREIVGHAAIFNEYTDMGWFQERVLPGAFVESIKSDDIRALFNHDPNYVLGRNKAKPRGTLSLKEDEKGLSIIIMPPDTQVARDLMTSIIRGDISQMSFAFKTLKDTWFYGENKERDLVKLKLYDVSPVTYPSYLTTDVAVRSFQAWNESHITPALGWKIGLMRKRLALKLKEVKKHE